MVPVVEVEEVVSLTPPLLFVTRGASLVWSPVGEGGGLGLGSGIQDGCEWSESRLMGGREGGREDRCSDGMPWVT